MKPIYKNKTIPLKRKEMIIFTGLKLLALLITGLNDCGLQPVWAADPTHYCIPRPNIYNYIYIDNYKPNSFCSLTLSEPGVPSMYIFFAENDMKDVNGVLYDYLLMFDGKDCMAERYAVGNVHSEHISSLRNIFTMLFISSTRVQGSRFGVKYGLDKRENEAQHNPKIYPPVTNILHNCGGELNSTTSRKIFWQEKERVNNLCIWRIRNENGGIITLQIDDLQLRSRFGFVRVLDGPDCSSKVIYFVAGDTSIQSLTFQSSTGAMLLVLGVQRAANDSITATYSFNSALQSASSSSSLSTRKSDSNKSTYKSTESDVYYSTATTTQTKSSSSSSTSTETDSIYPTTTSSEVDLIYSTTEEQQYNWSTSDVGPYYPGRAELNADCGEEIIVKTKGHVAWKKMGPKNGLCVWTVRSERGQRIALTLDDYQLHSGGYIRILDGSPDREKVIGQFAGCMMRQFPNIYANSGIIIIEIHMRSPINDDYFRAHFSSADDGAKTTGETGRSGVADRSPLGYVWLSLLLGALIH